MSYEGPTRPRGRLLIVEEEALEAEDIRERVTQAGYTVVTAVPSAQEALDAAERDRPDLVLMDIRLKGTMNGREAAARLRAQYDVPVVYWATRSDAATYQHAREVAPHGCLIEPFLAVEIRTTLETALYRAAVERRLREGEAQHRQLGCSLPALISHTDAQGRYTFVNDAYQTWFQVPAYHILGRHVRDVLGPETFESAEPFFDRAWAGEVVTFETSVTGVLVGEPMAGQVTLVPEGAQDGGGLYLIAVDVMPRVRLARALNKERERLQATLHCVGDGVVAADSDGIVEFMNPMAESLTGWSNAEATGEPVQNVMRLLDPFDHQPVWRPFAEALASGLVAELPPNTLLLSRDGAECRVRVSVVPILDAGGGIGGAVVVFRDSTAHRP